MSMQVHHFPFKAMGSPCELRLYTTSPGQAREVANRATAEVARLERKYSRYLPDSVTSRINQHAGTDKGFEVDEETAGLLNYAAVGYEQSGGLFDITSGILRRAWDFKTDRIPKQAEIDALLPCVGWKKLLWEAPVLTLPVAGMQLDFGGYVKEYAADSTATLCRGQGISGGLVDLGGDISIIGPHPDGSAWRIGVRDPRNPDTAMAMISLSQGGLASSGDYERFMIVDGQRYSHILNPVSGWPVSGLKSVSVVADQCLVAGTASTIAMLKGETGGMHWLDELGLTNLRMDQHGVISGTLARPN